MGPLLRSSAGSGGITAHAPHPARTGLDSAPSSASIPLPPSCEDRVSFIQHDLKERLPFADASFDFVRMSFVNLALREQDWQDVCEEALRVLKPGSASSRSDLAPPHLTAF